MNPEIKMRNINKYINLPWNWKYVSRNPNLSVKFIKEMLGKNSHIKLEDWNWEEISKNPGIKMVDIKENPDFSYVSGNKFTKDKENYIKKQILKVNTINLLNTTLNLVFSSEYLVSKILKF